MGTNSAAEFAGKVAVVTGAGAGLGEAIAIKLFENGANVVLADINERKAAAVAARIDPAGEHTLVLQTDVSDHFAVKNMVAQTVKHFGGLHMAVNNAGFTGPRETNTVDYEIEWWHKVIATDLSGVFYGLKYEIPAIISSGGGAIVNMSSVAGAFGTPGEIPYIAAKHGIVGLTQAAALEYAAKGIRITAVGPAFINTAEIQREPEEARAQLAALHPIGRLGTPEEVAEMVCFLLSDRASFVTGSFHLIDGGYAAR